MGTCCSNPPLLNEPLLTTKPLPQNLQINPFSDTEFTNKVTKIQAHYRGHTVRKNVPFKPNPNSNMHAPSLQTAHLAYELPIPSQKVQTTLKLAGPFVHQTPFDPNFPILGPYEFELGAFYLGQWKLGKREGHGKQVWNDGSVYEGSWLNNMATGYGRLVHADGDYYIGNWENDKANGYGSYIHTDGAKYEGFWKNDRQHGKGKEIWPDGAIYDGDYLNGKKHGKGKFIWADQNCFEGDFVDNDIQVKF